MSAVRYLNPAVETQVLADRINARLGAAVEAIVAVGIELIAAKGGLPHGEFGRLFKNHPDAVAQPLRFSKRTAEVLMSIARHPVLTDAQHVAHLPASWGTLGVLARLPGPVLEAAIWDGRVTPDLERRDAERLLADAGDDHELAKLRGLVDEHTMFWGSDRLLQGAAALREKADDLERDAQQLRGGDGARQAAALMTRMQTLASMSYNQLYRIGQLDPTAPELPQRPAR